MTSVYEATFDKKRSPDLFLEDYGKSMASACVANSGTLSSAVSWLSSNIKPALQAASSNPCVTSVHVAYTLRKVKAEFEIPAFAIYALANHQGHRALVVRVLCSSVSGSGRLLMAHVESVARAMGVQHVVIDTPTSTAHGFYVKLGYKSKDLSSIPYNAQHAFMKLGAFSPIFLYKRVV